MRRYYEFAIVVFIVSILALFIMRSIESTRLALEESTVQSEAAALRMELVEIMAHHETFGGDLPKSKNPLDWVKRQPANYLGIRDVVPDETSVWYFDERRGELDYRFRDGHLARFRLSNERGATSGRAMIAGVGLLRLENTPE